MTETKSFNHRLFIKVGPVPEQQWFDIFNCHFESWSFMGDQSKVYVEKWSETNNDSWRRSAIFAIFVINWSTVSHWVNFVCIVELYLVLWQFNFQLSKNWENVDEDFSRNLGKEGKFCAQIHLT